MITTGFCLATLTGLGFWFIFHKLPRRIRRFLQKHILLTDIGACILTYMLFGGTIVALFAAAWMGLIVSVILSLTSNPSINALLDRWTKKLIEQRNKLIAWLESKAPAVEGENNEGERAPASS